MSVTIRFGAWRKNGPELARSERIQPLKRSAPERPPRSKPSDHEEQASWPGSSEPSSQAPPEPPDKPARPTQRRAGGPDQPLTAWHASESALDGPRGRQREGRWQPEVTQARGALHGPRRASRKHAAQTGCATKTVAQSRAEDLTSPDRRPSSWPRKRRPGPPGGGGMGRGRARYRSFGCSLRQHPKLLRGPALPDGSCAPLRGLLEGLDSDVRNGREGRARAERASSPRIGWMLAFRDVDSPVHGRPRVPGGAARLSRSPGGAEDGAR
jgi:hypothetical protein